MRRSLAATERKNRLVCSRARDVAAFLRTGAVGLSIIVSGERLSQTATACSYWLLTTVMLLGGASVVWPIACPRKHLGVDGLPFRSQLPLRELAEGVWNGTRRFQGERGVAGRVPSIASADLVDSAIGRETCHASFGAWATRFVS
jgi:hypothetical protein